MGLHNHHTIHIRDGFCREVDRKLHTDDFDYRDNHFFQVGVNNGWAIWKIPSMLRTRTVDQHIVISTDCTSRMVANEYAFKMASALYPNYQWTQTGETKYFVRPYNDSRQFEIWVRVMDIRDDNTA